MKKFLLPVILLTGMNAFAQRQNDVAKKYAETINPEALKQKLSVIAGAPMEGRLTASAGQRRAAAYIENHFRKLGLLPGTAAGYQMYFPVYQDTIIDAVVEANSTPFKLDTDFSFDLKTIENGNTEIKEIVYVAGGIIDSAKNDYEGIDVKNKWILITDDNPAPEKRVGIYGLSQKVQQAKVLGAKGILVLTNEFPRQQPSATKGRMHLAKPSGTSVPVFHISRTLAYAVLGLDSTNLFELLNIIPKGSYPSKTQLKIYKRTLLLQSSNVLAVLPGTDKKDEYLLVTAHYDHEGIKNNQIYFGADDNGSGTTGVMQLAEAFAKAKLEGNAPRRSIVFMTVSGEEEGLLGSEYYSQNPPFPLSKTTADLNIDMVGRVDPNFTGDTTNYIYVIGDDRLSTDLAVITDSINARYMNMILDRKYNAKNEPSRFYFRSDHYNFAKKGVPVIFYFNGTHADYHKPTDTIDKINFLTMAKRVKLIFYTAWAIANRGEMLKRNIPLSE